VSLPWQQADLPVQGQPDQQVALDDAIQYLQADQQAAQSFAKPVDPGEKVRAWISGERRDAGSRQMSASAQTAYYSELSGDRSHQRSLALLREVAAEKYRMDWPQIVKLGAAIGVLAFLKYLWNRSGRD